MRNFIELFPSLASDGVVDIEVYCKQATSNILTQILNVIEPYV